MGKGRKEMVQITVTPEMLEEVANRASNTRIALESIHNNLCIDVFDKQIDPDGILRDPNTSEVLDWKPGQARKNKVDFGHTEGNTYKNMFEKYKNREITLKELKEFQFNSDNFRLEKPSVNRSHKYE
ncbi:hypothetical protein EXW39_05320 [Bacillus mycoides]|nr:hypothetical protein EXW39_05320 [Bacillus mycoides]